MTTRAEKMENPVVLEEPRGGILFLRYGRSAGHDLLSTVAPLARKLKKRGCRLDKESILPGASLIGNLTRLIRLAREYQTIHLFFEHNTARIGLALPAIILARFFGCRMILSFTGPIDDPPFGHISSPIRQLLNLCDLVTVPSAYHLRLFEKYRIRARHLVPVVEAILRTEVDYSSIVPVVLVALPLEESSNIPSAIRAVELVKQKYPRTRLVILGCGSQKDRLQSIASAVNHDAIEVVVTQSPQHFFDCLEEADIYLCSSLDNYLPISLIHALHSGTPVVAVTNAVISEVIADGVNGLLTDRTDHAALADKLFQLVESEELRRALADRGQLAAKPLEWGSIREEWRSLYY